MMLQQTSEHMNAVAEVIAFIFGVAYVTLCLIAWVVTRVREKRPEAAP